jgi:glycosyltransferase involved in cell wall biosynthesis
MQEICKKDFKTIKGGAIMPKVSICIPCYNNADEVERLLNSILEQNYTDFEVNISDDSTDTQTQILMEKYKGRIANLRYVHNEKPYGHIINWNVAIKMATGEYIKIMFSDDWFTDSASLGGLVKLLDDNEDAIFAFSGSRQVMLDGQNIENMHHVTSKHNKASYDRFASREYIDKLRNDYRYLFVSNQIGAPSAVIYRRDKDGKIALFDEESNWASDVFLYFELFGKAANMKNAFEYTKKPLVSIGVHASQYTETFSEQDIRIYNDYKYMYTKYNLVQSRECREYFAKKYIVKYHKGLQEAKSLGIERHIVILNYVSELKEAVKCFIGSRIGWRK